MADGPGEMHGFLSGTGTNPPSERRMRWAARVINGKQKLRAALAVNPHLKKQADELLAQEGWDEWDVLRHLKLADKQFTFINGTKPPPERRYRANWD